MSRRKRLHMKKSFTKPGARVVGDGGWLNKSSGIGQIVTEPMRNTRHWDKREDQKNV